MVSPGSSEAAEIEAHPICPVNGLTEQAAQRRLQQEGYNELPTSRPGGVLALALSIAQEPMLLLLVAAAVIYLFLGDVREAFVLLASVSVVSGITLYQERRSERALEALRDLSSPRALVIRDGAERRIAGREVVRGDLVILAEGDRVPADGVVIEATNLSVDESLLTGESAPVRKLPWRLAQKTKDEQRGSAAESGVVHADGASAVNRDDDLAQMSRPGGDDLPFVYSGTMVVQGTGLIEVRETGQRTELGQIGRALGTIAVERTPVQREVGRLVRILAIEAIALCVLVVVAYGILRGHWLEGILAGITLAMSVIPEEFPLVLTLFLALGAWRLAQRQVLTRRMPAIETLGAATVLCSDKTGTLTQNRMSVGALVAATGATGGPSDAAGATDGQVGRYDQYDQYDVTTHAGERVPEPFLAVLRAAALASQISPFDPMERALHALVARSLPPRVPLDHGLSFVREYPLTPDLLAVTRVWRTKKTGDGASQEDASQERASAQCERQERDFVIMSKGAPEAIASLCRLDEAHRDALLVQVGALAQEGLRVLAVAQASVELGPVSAELPESPLLFPFTLLGLVGLADPVRPSVPAAMRDCDTAGIRVVMITGDYPATAQAIAQQIGFRRPDQVITGPELETMSDDALRERVRETAIFARVVPQQKLRLVRALKANGEIVGMTGDGVNDAPALRAADIGIAMGGRGTDVAREAAALVLLDDDFTSIVAAVRGGRRIFDNLRKAMGFVFAIHIPIAGLALLPVLFGWPLILLPVHIVFLEFIIDPASTLVFEAEPDEPDVMERPPRDPRARLFSVRLLILSALQGVSILAAVLAVFLAALHVEQGEAEARTLAFATLVVANLALVLANRSWSRLIIETLRVPNVALWWVVAGAIATLGLVIYVPAPASLFRFGVLHPLDVLLCLAVGLASMMWFEALKLGRRYLAQGSAAAV